MFGIEPAAGTADSSPKCAARLSNETCVAYVVMALARVPDSTRSTQLAVHPRLCGPRTESRPSRAPAQRPESHRPAVGRQGRMGAAELVLHVVEQPDEWCR